MTNTREWFNIKVEQLPLTRTLLLVRRADPLLPRGARRSSQRNPTGKVIEIQQKKAPRLLAFCEHF
ncbi:hypothetical protein BFJ70_g9385 [Fusarium oxysporum]|uniref:Uncharacterized protein n=1 Tax=Fusarium oxysporum TaxID=5507 RepID=A0A420RHP8_FUSOX|nr:hypothetical protein BFJ68_g5163 [Fusarium oxysporum]RKL32065.1 hypothetical protein BFJ70_g9385 [Fusarium oxysporum]